MNISCFKKNYILILINKLSPARLTLSSSDLMETRLAQTNQMLNKRLLVKNIISNHDEGTFYDRKEMVDLETSMGKSKILPCAKTNVYLKFNLHAEVTSATAR